MCQNLDVVQMIQNEVVLLKIVKKKNVGQDKPKYLGLLNQTEAFYFGPIQDQSVLAQAAVCTAGAIVQDLSQILFCRAGCPVPPESSSHNEQERDSLTAAQASQDSWPTKPTWDISHWKLPCGLCQVKTFLGIHNVFSSTAIHFKVASKQKTFPSS